MKLLQLRYILEIFRNGMSISHAAEKLFTSQPGISKQVRKLEQELGVSLFVRKGKHLTGVTPAGEHILKVAGQIMDKTLQIKSIAKQHRESRVGRLTIGTTHNQARYVLPKVIDQFIALYPNIRLNIHQGTPMQIAEDASRGRVDLVISAEAMENFDNLIALPGMAWNRCVIVPRGHALSDCQNLPMAVLADYPIVTYVHGFSGRSEIDKAFEKSHLHPQYVLTAVDADVIKTYVRIGLGVGIVAEMAYSPVADHDLVALDASHLFARSVTKIGFRRDLFFRDYLYDFIALFCPSLTREAIEKAVGEKPIIAVESEWEEDEEG